MISYLSIPILDLFITFVDEESDYVNNVKALLSSIFSHCFPLTMGYAVAPRKNCDYSDSLIYGFRILFGGDRGFVDQANRLIASTYGMITKPSNKCSTI